MSISYFEFFKYEDSVLFLDTSTQDSYESLEVFDPLLIASYPVYLCFRFK